MTTETTLNVRCPHCKTAFRALPEHAGRRAKCSHCDGTIVIPGEVVKPPERPAEIPQPQYVGVNCLLCGTRMYGTLADVGKELKCPDCGRRTKLPPPEVKKKQIPAALDGEQYDLWEGDEQPWGVTLSAEGPRYIAVECRLCQTHLQTTVDQAGKKIRCHDCGAETVVKLPATGSRPKPQPATVVDEYEVDDSVPPVVPPSFYSPSVEKTEKTADAVQRPTSKKVARDEPLDAEFRKRPKLPRWPLLSGNFPFLRSSGVPSRIFVMSGSLLVPGIILAIISSVGSAILGVILLPLLIVLTLVWIAATAAASMAIVTEASEGNDQVYAWPSSAFMDWLPELGTLLVALMVSAFPGWLVAKLSPELTQIGLLLMVASVLLFLPIALLSQLAESSVWAILSPTVVMSWFRCPLSWFGFYLQSALLLAAVGVTGYAALTITLSITLLLIPLAITGVFYYFRIMGRLAWVIEESTPVAEDEDEREKV
ncbi:MAG: hypothetical protein WD851_09495 [Pirellulales bacterium]